MRIRLHLILSLMLAVTLVALTFAHYQVRAVKRGLRADLEKRAVILAESLEETLVPLLQKRSQKNLLRIVERFGNRERLVGVVVYDEGGSPLAVTSGLSGKLPAPPDAVALAMSQRSGRGEFRTLGQAYVHLYVLPLYQEEEVVGALAIFHDATYIEAQSGRIWRDTLLRVSLQTLLIALITLLVIRWSIEGPIAKTAEWMRELRLGGGPPRSSISDRDIFKPLTQEVTHIVKSLEAARAAAEEEARLRQAAESLWTGERLRVHVQNKLQGSPLFVVSNREPYMHVRRGKSTEVLVPASGLVTALEPILRACDGTWIAHGAGDADREMADEHARLRVPPEEPHYALRRVWITKEEEEGYYYGFANEGLWPLCHIAHTRPIFRSGDWGHYQKVNQRFAQAALEEMAEIENPALLVQDYHFALLPRLIKEKRPDARVAIFWHIPWPNPQAFGICPWQREILDGLLGADLIGFHIQGHCNFFLETVDQTLESRIDWERFAVNRLGHFTLVRPFPISVSVPEAAAEPSSKPGSVYLDRAALFKDMGVQATFMGLGVDRVDYTKGILERFRGIEYFMEKHPAYRGQFTFVQIGAPSRTHIKRYNDLFAELGAEADRINWRFQAGEWKPIVFLNRHHSHKEIEPYYKAADLCMVTSLHDGMNLVAKEFVAARDDEQGALILSRFTGASRELRDALVVNPYDTEQLAEAIRFALEMDPDERRARMQRMRRTVKEHNVYRWAANLITELSEIRLDRPAPVKAG
jgi:trehalose 6-phosphate synthase